MNVYFKLSIWDLLNKWTFTISKAYFTGSHCERSRNKPLKSHKNKISESE